jgi:hypothetical protein
MGQIMPKALTPQEAVEKIKINPVLLKAAPLEYLLPKVSQLPSERFLRWGEVNAAGRFLYDPTQLINKKLGEVILSVGLVPSISVYGNENKIYIIKRGITKTNQAVFPNSPESIQKVGDFIKAEPLFYFGYDTEGAGISGIRGHAILFKKIPGKPNTLELINPYGGDLSDLYASMGANAVQISSKLFTAAGITNFEPARCVVQTQRDTCMLWVTLFSLYPEKDYKDIVKMVDDAIQKIGLRQGIISRDMFIMELFYEFIQNPVLASSVPADYREGFGRKLKGKALPDDLTILQQIAKQSYNLVDPQEDVNGWILKKWTPTMKFYVKGNDVIVGVRGTKTNAPDGNFDVSADLTIPFNGIPGTTRYKRDKAAVQQFLQQFPSPQYSYYAVGHSLGGAIIDSLIRDKLIKEALSYNPAIQSGDINAGLPNRRIYFGSDPLYRLMGWLDRKSEHREPKNRTWADFLGAFSPAAAAMAALPAHNLSNFEGGKRGKLGKKVVFT